MVLATESVDHLAKPQEARPSRWFGNVVWGFCGHFLYGLTAALFCRAIPYRQLQIGQM